jgi:hypothetical protein
VERSSRFRDTLNELVEFATFEPYTTALGTVVNSYAQPFNSDQLKLMARGAFHEVNPTKTTENRLFAKIIASTMLARKPRRDQVLPVDIKCRSRRKIPIFPCASPRICRRSVSAADWTSAGRHSESFANSKPRRVSNG